MATLPALTNQLARLGRTAKSVGPDLFSPAQAPGPAPLGYTSMATDRYAASVSPPPPIQQANGWGGGLGMDVPPPITFNAPQQITAQQSANPYISPGGGSASTGSLGGEYGQLDQYDAAFQQAAARYGIDANWLKAIAATERGWEGTSVAGAQGLMQIMPGGYAGLEALYPNWRTDPTQNILLGAAILREKMNENGGSLEQGTRGYLGFGTDAYGTSDTDYLARVQDFYGQLGANGGSFGGGESASLAGMFGTGVVPDWGEFGVESDNGFYDYGVDYGLNGTQHTGADVPMAVGTPYRAPMGGVVTCGGTGNGTGADGAGCDAFDDEFGNGAGRVEVLLDNGVVLIFGHSSTSMFRPGQRFNAGDVLGTSGGMVSAHVHLEARVRDASTNTGWRIVDPRGVLGGGSSGSYPGGGSYGGSTVRSGRSGMNVNQLIYDFLFGGGR